MIQDRIPLRERAKGRWGGILPMVCVPAKHLTGKHGPCPMCGGKDRFRFDDKDGDGTWICSHCGAGSGADLVMKIRGCDFAEAAKLIEDVLGQAKPRQPKPAMDDARRRDALNRLWRSSLPVADDDPVARYLAARIGLRGPYPASLRTCGNCLYSGEPKRWFPAMVAMVVGPDGKAATLHRTYLTEEGEKAPVEAPRRVMPGMIPKGAAVRLSDVAPTLGIAEGIETALSATAIFQVPCWAALNATMLAAWFPPEGVEAVTIFADNDPGFAGQAAAFELARRLSDRVKVRIEMPQHEGEDWNDELLRRHGMAPIGTRARHGLAEHAA